MQENRGLFTLDAAQAYLAKEPEMVTEQLSERLFTVSDGQVRTIFLAGENSVIAFDTFGTPGRARAYGKAIAAAIPGKPIGTIIYSHDHLDHAGFAHSTRVLVKRIEAEDLEEQGPEILLSSVDGVLVPGGFGMRGVEGPAHLDDDRREDRRARGRLHELDRGAM